MLEVKEEHDCPLPSMIIGQQLKTVSSGFLGLFTRQVEVPLYDSRQALFTCDDCGARWKWNGWPQIYGAAWSCEWRPETWKIVDAAGEQSIGQS